MGCIVLREESLNTTNGSLEYTHHISFEETDGWHLGKKIVFSFNSINLGSHQKAGLPVPWVEGYWELKWTLSGTSDSISFTSNKKIWGQRCDPAGCRNRTTEHENPLPSERLLGRPE